MSLFKLPNIHVGLISFLVLGSGVLYGSWRVQKIENSASRMETLVIAELASLRLGQFLQSHMFAASILAEAFEDGTVQTQPQFEAAANRLHDSFAGFRAINWVDADGAIQWITPLASNEAALGVNVLEKSASREAFTAARDSVTPHITSPITLLQGETGVVAYFPVAPAGNGILGYVNAVFTTDALIAEVLSNDTLARYDVWIDDRGTLLFGAPSTASAEARAKHAVQRSVPVLNRLWDVHISRAQPAWASIGGVLDTTLLLWGMALAGALAAALHTLFGAQTGRRMAAEERSALESQLLHAQKMEAVGRLAGGVAHDFNNLLTTILGNADLIENVGGLDANATASLDQIRIAGERATQLTGKLLTISRKQVLQPKLIDFNKEMLVLDGVLRRLIRENIEFQEQLDSSACVVELDSVLLSQIIINLVMNAVDAMPAGGTLLVRTETETSMRDGEQERWVVLTVEDTGVGMDESTRRRALEPFFTTKGTGTGLGLATVEGIASSSGGRVEIRNNNPSGTCVSVWLPVSDKILIPVAPTPEAPPAVGGRALIVEDEPAVRSLGARLLRDNNFEVFEAPNGAEALDLARSLGQFDLVFTDAVMPKLSGRGLLEQLRIEGFKFDAVITSGYPDELSASDIERLGAEFLAKPYSSKSLRQAIHNAADIDQPAPAV